MAKQSPEMKRVRKLERVIEDLLDYLAGHHCAYCGTKQCAVGEAEKALQDTSWKANG